MFREALRRAAYLLRRNRFESELEDEIRFHMESRAEELEQSGMPRAAAMAQARREFGGGARAREETRSAWQLRRLEDLAGDLRYAGRALRRNPAFAATAIACLALGIGANTTIFSLAAEMLFSQPSCRDAGTLLHLEAGGNSHSPMRVYRFLRDARAFRDLVGANAEQEVNWRHGDATRRLFAVRVTDNYFTATGTPLAIGRPPEPGEGDRVVLSHRLWRQQLGGDPQIAGRPFELDGKPYTVAGVLPPDHRTLLGFGFSPDLYVPVSDDKATVALYARTSEGMTRGEASARLRAALEEYDRTHPEGNHKWAKDVRVTAISGMSHLMEEEMMKPVAFFFAMLMTVVGLLLLIACANVASLLLARGAGRAHEFAIRLSIGAGRGRILRQLLAESLLLAACGSAAGVALNFAATAAINSIRLPLPIPIQFAIRPDVRLLAYSVALALVSTLVCGLAPALESTRRATEALRQDQHQVGGRWALRNTLVAGQIAVSMVLLCAGMLFLRNLVHAQSMNPGFDLDRTVWAYQRLTPEAARRPGTVAAMVETALERLRSLPGVESAAIARVVPLNDNMTTGADVFVDSAGHTVHVGFHNNYVGPDYFRTMGIRILRGREFLASDRKGAPRVGIVNAHLAHQLFGDGDPVGHTLAFERGMPIEIVGVAANSKYFTLGEAGAAAYYEPFVQGPGSRGNLHFLLRSKGRPEDVVAGVRQTLGPLDPTAALEVKPMHSALAFALLPSRAGAVILGAMGLLGLLLAAIGLYGVLLYAVGQRTREIGLRVALGASPAGILRLVLSHSSAVVAAGMAAGLALSIFAVRPLAMFLIPEVRPSDTVNYAAVGLLLGAVALAATVFPALRALRADPAVALRHD